MLRPDGVTCTCAIKTPGAAGTIGAACTWAPCEPWRLTFAGPVRHTDIGPRRETMHYCSAKDGGAYYVVSNGRLTGSYVYENQKDSEPEAMLLSAGLVDRRLCARSGGGTATGAK